MPEWNELFLKQENRWENPHELTTILAERLGPRPASILDLGCGAGRHLVSLGRLGYQLAGMDVSDNGLRYSQGWLQREGLPARLTRADMTHLPYTSASFDAVVSIHVIFHNPLARLMQSMGEIRRVLKPGGWAALTFQSTRSYRYGRGEQIELNTFLPDLGEDAGVPHHYSTFGELDDLFAGFIVHRVFLNESLERQNRRSSHWDVLAEKA